MAIHDAGMFTVKEINRLKILQDVIERNLRPGQAAEMLGITPRHCSRLLKRYRQSGPLGMNNQSRGRTGNRLLPASLTDEALSIIRERYRDFGPTLAREKLEEVHGLILGKETIRRLMIKAGLWIPRRQRAPKIHQPRYRRPCTGELIQIDGCDHHWFENRGRPCTALVYVDDATSRLMHLLFVKSESTFTYFEATRGYIEKYGKPMILYSDKASVFRVNNKHATTGPGETQFARAMRCLNITPLCAETSQAKGRVERAHLTLQDRLVKELRLKGISTIDAANAFAEEYMTDYNQRFAKAPREHGVGYQFESEEIIRIDSQLIHADVVKPTLILLSGEPLFEGANDEFLAAHEHYRHKRYKECLNDCLKSFESIMKAIHDKNNWKYSPNDTASKLINSCLSQNLIPAYLQSQFTSLKTMLETGIPTIRNKNAGHGQGADIKEVPEELASYMLHLTATNLLFLLKCEKNIK